MSYLFLTHSQKQENMGLFPLLLQKSEENEVILSVFQKLSHELMEYVSVMQKRKRKREAEAGSGSAGSGPFMLEAEAEAKKKELLPLP